MTNTPKEINWRKWGYYALRMTVVILALSFAFFPIVWIISAAINPAGTLSTHRLIPPNPGLDNFDELLNSDIHPFATWMWNSVKVSSVTAILGVMISALGAYSFSRFRFTGRRSLMLTIFLIQVFPNSLSIVGTFLLVQEIGKFMSFFGLNSHGGLILVYLGGALGINTWLMKGFFDTIPRELDESARIDGASNFMIFWRIIFPLVQPVLAVVGILSFIGVYGDVIISLTLLKDTDVQTLAIGLNNFVSADFTDNWGIFAAGSLIGAIPIVILILTFQRFLVGGLTEGAVKG
jgi:ABC-type maltose transport system permease subunit